MSKNTCQDIKTTPFHCRHNRWLHRRHITTKTRVPNLSPSHFLPVRCVWAAGQGWRRRRTRSWRRFADPRPVCFSGKRAAPSPRRWARRRPPRTARGRRGVWSAAGSSAAWLARSTAGVTQTWHHFLHPPARTTDARSHLSRSQLEKLNYSHANSA